MKVFDVTSGKSVVSHSLDVAAAGHMVPELVNVHVQGELLEDLPSSTTAVATRRARMFGRERISRRSSPSIANSFSRPSNNSDILAPERNQRVTMYGCVMFNPNSR